jgi:threonine/homoserine/homoserine lactone efflux protein
VAVTVGFVGLLPKSVLDAVSLAGGLFVAYLAQDAWWSVSAETASQALKQAAGSTYGSSTEAPPTPPAPRPASFGRATLVNLLNPHAWLFWAIIGAPITIRAARVSFWHGAGFVLAFYIGLIGLKICLALVVGRGVMWLGTRFQKWVVRVSGVGLAIIAALLIIEGLRGLIFH